MDLRGVALTGHFDFLVAIVEIVSVFLFVMLLFKIFQNYNIARLKVQVSYSLTMQILQSSKQVNSNSSNQVYVQWLVPLS